MNVSIKEETEADFADVYQLNRSAFGQESEATLVELLRNSNSFVPGLSLVATIENKVVGHILFTQIKIKNTSDNEYQSLALAPMAVKPELQNQGIGTALVTAGLAKARELGHLSVIVLGHENYYPRFGFQPAVKWNITSPFDVPSNTFMAIELIDGALKTVSGIVEYQKEFYEV
jgi:putative acetyltransferase